MYQAICFFLCPSGSILTVPTSFFSPSAIQISAISLKNCPVHCFIKVKLFRERSLCLKMRLHFICSTLLSFGFFVNRNRKNTVSSLILKPFRKWYFPARGPFVLSYSVGGLDTEGPMKRLHVVGQRVCDFPAMYPSEPAALAGCGWPWPAPPRAEQLYCLFSVLDSCRRHHWEKGSAA